MTEEEVTEQVACAECSEPREPDDLTDVQGGDQVCEECLDSHYIGCEPCGQWVSNGETTTVNDGEEVCESCLHSGDYWTCDACREWRGGTYVYSYTTLEEHTVCEGCRDEMYPYCEDCDGYYHENNETDHRHSDCDCEAPAQEFRVRNDGEAALVNDTRVTVTLPAGTISAEGMEQIAVYLLRWSRDNAPDDPEENWEFRRHYCNLSYNLDKVGDQWQRKDGNFAKRLSRYAYKSHGIKLAPEVMSHVGCVARDHSLAVDFDLEVTRNLNLPAEEFAHEESCWWQSYSCSRCALKSNGGFGLRTFERTYGSVSGRAWVMPMRLNDGNRLVPTFNTETPSAFVVFNGYRDLSGYAPARIMSHMAGMTYRKIGFYCDQMYVNGESGYLVAPEEIASKYDDGSLRLDVEKHSDLYERESASVAEAIPAERVAVPA